MKLSIVSYINKNKMIINYILVLLIAVLLLALIIIGFHFIQIDVEIVNNILTPIIAAIGFAIVIFTLYDLKRNLNYRISKEYYEFIENKVEKFIHEVLEYNFDELRKTKTLMFEDTTLLNCTFYRDSLNSYVRTDKDYMQDMNNFNKIKKKYEEKEDLKGFYEYLYTRPYYKYYSDLTYLVAYLSKYYNKGALLVKEIIDSDQLIDNHKDLLLRKIIIEIYQDYFNGILSAVSSNFELVDRVYFPPMEYLYDYNYFSFLYKIFDNPVLSNIVTEELSWGINKEKFENYCKGNNYPIPKKRKIIKPNS